MATTPISAPTSLPSIHDMPSEYRSNVVFTQEVVANAKLDLVTSASNIDRLIETKKSKLVKDLPRSPSRVLKCDKSSEPRQFYDEAWDIRLSRLSLKKNASSSPQNPSSSSNSNPSQPTTTTTSSTSMTVMDGGGGVDKDEFKVDELHLRCPPDGAATYDTSSFNSIKIATTPTNPQSESKSLRTELPIYSKPDVISASNSTGDDSGDGFSTPTPSTPWFPPPPPTPLHLSLPEPNGNQGRRYHEHGRSFEDDEGGELRTNLDPSDAISLPPISPPPPPPPEGIYPATGRSSVSSSSFSLPQPPSSSMDDFLPCPPPPAIPPRDPTTSLQSSLKSNLRLPDAKESMSAKLDDRKLESSSNEPSEQTYPSGNQPNKVSVAEPTIWPTNRTSIVSDVRNGRSVVPWEPSDKRASTLPGPGTDLLETLPQWVPPQHSEAVQRGNTRIRGNTKTSMVPMPAISRHRLAKSQGSDGELMLTNGIEANERSRPISLAARSNASSSRRRHTTNCFANDICLSPSEADIHPFVNSTSAQYPRISQHNMMRMHSDSGSTGQACNSRIRISNDVWNAAVSHSKDDFESDSVNQFVHVGYDMRSANGGRGNPKIDSNRLSHPQNPHNLAKSTSQRHPVVTQRLLSEPGMLVEPGEMPESMTQSLIMSSGGDDEMWTDDGQKSQQQRMCRRMRAVHLTESGVVLSPQDYPQPQRRSGRVQRVLFSKSASSSDQQIHDMSQSVWLPHDVEWGPANHSQSSELRSPQDGSGYLFQTQISCPSNYSGGQWNMASWEEATGQEFDPTSEIMLDYRNSQTAPGHFPGQSYMMWPPVMGNGRRRRGNHTTTQPIIVSSADHPDQMFVGKRSMGQAVTSTIGQNGRPQALISGRQRVKQRQDLATLASLPIEEQSWFHGILSRVEAEALLRSAHPGSFLVRTSETSKSAFSLSIRRDRDFLHMKISFDPKSNAYILGEYSQPYPTVPIMVHHYTRNLLPVRGTKPVLLLYPVCRSLGHFSRQTP